MKSGSSFKGLLWRSVSIFSLIFITHCGQGGLTLQDADTVSPAGEENNDGGPGNGKNATPNFEVRSMDGTGNNLQHESWGSSNTPLLRLAPSGYADGISSPAGANRPNVREISNEIIDQVQSIPNDRNLSSFVFAWGQFIDHDIDLTLTNPEEPLPILVPLGDAFFDPDSTGAEEMDFFRSVFDPNSGTSADNPREQLNAITAYIDASNIYGSDDERATWLRTGEGGKLKASEGDFLPFNDGTQENAPSASTDLFVSGDVRANETVTLTALHTLFMREHNRLCDKIAEEHPDWTDEQIYQRARRWVGAFLQSITYNEFLPAMMGSQAPGSYPGYDESVKPAIFNEFSTALYRVGHTMLPEELLLSGKNQDEAISLKDAFFNPQLVLQQDIDPILRGLVFNPMEEIDVHMVDGVRNFLFGLPGDGGLDLASLNLQRGRDHGLADYNSLRAAVGLSPIKNFDQLTSRGSLRSAFESLYGSVDDMDLWVASLAEDHRNSSSVGETIARVLKIQFDALRNGDRFWFENDPAFTDGEVDQVRKTRLSDIILRNTSIENLPANVFRVP